MTFITDKFINLFTPNHLLTQILLFKSIAKTELSVTLQCTKHVCMARQKNQYLPISGRMGDLIYYFRKDIKNRAHYHVRQAPATVKQTAATKRASTDFGTASTSSCLLRTALDEYCYDKKLHYHLIKKMREILSADVSQPSGQKVFTAANMQGLKYFRFNGLAAIQNNPVFEINNAGNISISVPATFRRNSNTTHIAVKAIALSVNFRKNTTQKLESNTVVIKRGEESTTLKLNINRRNLTLIILEIQSFYEVNGQLHMSQDRRENALDVIEVLAPIEPPKEQKRKYSNKAPQFWQPYSTPATPALIIMPVNYTSLPEG
jgi:hypothetical protein